MKELAVGYQLPSAHRRLDVSYHTQHCTSLGTIQGSRHAQRGFC